LQNIANGQPGNCGNGQICMNGACTNLPPVGLGQACNITVNNCIAGTTCGSNGFCNCSGTAPNQCGNRCVNNQTDGSACGASCTNCGAGIGCVAGRCNCPANTTFANGACKANDGQPCTTAANCVSNVCTSWFSDRDGDGFGAGAATQRCGSNSPPGAGFVTNGTDCCDSSADVHPNQNATFADPLPAACAAGRPDHDYNCNNRNEGFAAIDCTLRNQNNCAASGIIPMPQVDLSTQVDGVQTGTVICGRSVTTGGCAFFATDEEAQASGQGTCQQAGCCPTFGPGFGQVGCN
jgi:hypothetical protein